MAIRKTAGGKVENKVVTDKKPENNPLPISPRSSNLRVRKEFSDHDKDEFLEETFHYIAKYFEVSLTELKTRNPELNTRFTKVDAHHIKSFIYRNGSLQAQGKLWLSHSNMMKGIAYSANDSGSDSSFNEHVSVHNDDQQLFLRPLGMAMMFRRDSISEKLSQEGAAEYFWSIFIQNLQ
jgi:hypothetical protein